MARGFDDDIPSPRYPDIKRTGFAPTDSIPGFSGARAVPASAEDFQLVSVWHGPVQEGSVGILYIYGRDAFGLVTSLRYRFTVPDLDYEFGPWSSIMEIKDDEDVGVVGQDESFTRVVRVPLRYRRNTIVQYEAKYPFQDEEYVISDEHEFDLDLAPEFNTLDLYTLPSGQCFTNWEIDEDGEAFRVLIQKKPFDAQAALPDSAGPELTGFRGWLRIDTTQRIVEDVKVVGIAYDQNDVTAMTVNLPGDVAHKVDYYAWIPPVTGEDEGSWEKDNDFSTTSTRRRVVITLTEPENLTVNTIYKGTVSATDGLGNTTSGFPIEIGVEPAIGDEAEPHDGSHTELTEPHRYPFTSQEFSLSSEAFASTNSSDALRDLILQLEQRLDSEGELVAGRTGQAFRLGSADDFYIQPGETAFIAAQPVENIDGTGRRGPIYYRNTEIKPPPTLRKKVHQYEDTVSGTTYRFGRMRVFVDGDQSLIEKMESRKGSRNLRDLDELDPGDPQDAQILTDQAWSEETAIDPAHTVVAINVLDDTFDISGDWLRYFSVGKEFTVNGGANAGTFTVDSAEIVDVGGDEYTRVHTQEEIFSSDATGSTISVEGDEYYEEVIRLQEDHLSQIQFRATLKTGYAPLEIAHVFDFDEVPRFKQFLPYVAYDQSEATVSLKVDWAMDEDGESFKWKIYTTRPTTELTESGFDGASVVNGKSGKNEWLQSIEGLSNLGNVFYVAAWPYSEESGGGVPGSFAEIAEVPIVEPPDVFPKPYQIGSVGTYELHVADPENLITKVEFKEAEGRGFLPDDPWVEDPNPVASGEQGYDLKYVTVLNLSEKHTSSVAYRVTFVGGVILGDYTFDRDDTPNVTLSWVRDGADLKAVFTVDEDSDGVYYKTDTDPISDALTIDENTSGIIEVAASPGVRKTVQITPIAEGDIVYIAFAAKRTDGGSVVVGPTRTASYERPAQPTTLSLSFTKNQGDVFLTWSGPPELEGIRYTTGIDTNPADPDGTSSKLPVSGTASSGTDQIYSGLQNDERLIIKVRRIVGGTLEDYVFSASVAGGGDDDIAELRSINLFLDSRKHVFMSWGGSDDVTQVRYTTTQGISPPLPAAPGTGSDGETGQAGLVEVLTEPLPTDEKLRVRARGMNSGGDLSPTILHAAISGFTDQDTTPTLLDANLNVDEEGDVWLTWVGDDDVEDIVYDAEIVASGPFDEANFPVDGDGEPVNPTALEGVGKSGSVKILNDLLPGQWTFVAVRGRNEADELGPVLLISTKTRYNVQLTVSRKDGPSRHIFQVQVYAAEEGDYVLRRYVAYDAPTSPNGWETCEYAASKVEGYFNKLLAPWATNNGLYSEATIPTINSAAPNEAYFYELVPIFLVKELPPSILGGGKVSNLNQLVYSYSVWQDTGDGLERVSNIESVVPGDVGQNETVGMARVGTEVQDQEVSQLSLVEELRGPVLAGTVLSIPGRGGIPSQNVQVSQDTDPGADTLPIVSQRLQVGKGAIIIPDPAWVLSALSVLPDLTEQGIRTERDHDAIARTANPLTDGQSVTQIQLDGLPAAEVPNDTELIVLNEATRAKQTVKLSNKLEIDETTLDVDSVTIQGDFPAGSPVMYPDPSQAKLLAANTSAIASIEVSVSNNTAEISLNASAISTNQTNIASIDVRASALESRIVLAVDAQGNVAEFDMGAGSFGSEITLKADQIDINGVVTIINNGQTVQIEGGRVTAAGVLAQNAEITGTLTIGGQGQIWHDLGDPNNWGDWKVDQDGLSLRSWTLGKREDANAVLFYDGQIDGGGDLILSGRIYHFDATFGGGVHIEAANANQDGFAQVVLQTPDVAPDKYPDKSNAIILDANAIFGYNRGGGLRIIPQMTGSDNNNDPFPTNMKGTVTLVDGHGNTFKVPHLL